jgi:hypothetical protein
MERLFILMLAIGVLQGCATTLKLYPVAAEGQKEIFQGGIETLISAKQSLVAIRPSDNTYQSEQRPSLVVTITNGTDEPYNFGPGNISASVNGQYVKVFTYDELVAEVKAQQAWAVVATALNAAVQSMNAANAGYTYNSGTYNPSYSGSDYSGYGYGSSGYTYNAAAAQQAQAASNAQTQANMTAIQTQTNVALNQLEATMLRKETVFPQKTFGGYITLDDLPVPDSENEVIIDISAGGEMHKFKFKVTKVDK